MSVALDAGLSAFAEDGFSPVEYVNRICKACPGVAVESVNSSNGAEGADIAAAEDTALEKHLAETEVKLQLAAEDVAASLEEASLAGLQRVPRALREVNRIRDSVSTLREGLDDIIISLVDAEAKSSSAVSVLSQINGVKVKLETARATLQDAAGFSDLASKVEDIFAKGDLEAIADTLASMQRCLAVVGDVPELSGGRKKLSTLEERLEAMVASRLQNALARKKSEETKMLAGILSRVGRSKSFETAYFQARLPMVTAFWSEFDPSKDKLDTFLPKFFDQLLLLIESELKWLGSVLKSEIEEGSDAAAMVDLGAVYDHYELVAGMVGYSLESINSKSFEQKLQAITAGDNVDHNETPLENLITMHSSVAAFARNAAQLLKNLKPGEVMTLMRSVFASFETQKHKYGELERRQLRADCAVALALRPKASLVESTSAMESAISDIISGIETANTRCLTFTGGTESDSFLKIADEISSDFVSILQRIVHDSRSQYSAILDKRDDRKQDDSGFEGWESLAAGSLAFLRFSRTLTSRLFVVEASLRANLTQTERKHAEVRKISLENLDQEKLTDPGVVRMLHPDLQSKMKKVMITLHQVISDDRVSLLPQTNTKSAQFTQDVQSLMYGCYISKVSLWLSGVAGLDSWTLEEEDEDDVDKSAGGAIDAYPQHFTTTIGEYLLSLPHLLEPLMGGVSQGDDSFLAPEWAFKIANGAAHLCANTLLKIQALSESGSKQLVADLDYLGNVLAALSVDQPTSLVTLRHAASLSLEDLATLVATPKGSKTNKSEFDMRVAEAVMKMRKAFQSRSDED